MVRSWETILSVDRVHGDNAVREWLILRLVDGITAFVRSAATCPRSSMVTMTWVES